MAICGYNAKIGEGLRLLVEGMIDALQMKASEASVESVLSRELVELENIISVLRSAKGEVLPGMFIGLNLLAMELFSEVQRQLCSEDPQELAARCRHIAEQFIGLVAATERESQQLPLTDVTVDGIAARARLLASWAVSQSKQDVITAHG